MLKEVWTNDYGRVDQCIRTCGLMLEEVWINA